MWYVVLTFKDDIFRSDFMRSFVQFQHQNITSHKLSHQINEKFYHVKQTVENRRPSKMGDVFFGHNLAPVSGSANAGTETQWTSFFSLYRTYVSLYYNAYH
jgi:hypothetical protein